MIKEKLEIPGGGGSKGKDHLWGGGGLGMDVFWNHTLV